MSWWKNNSTSSMGDAQLVCVPARDVQLSGMDFASACVPVVSRNRNSWYDTRKISMVIVTRYEKIRPSERAWAALVLGVLAYEVFCKEGEMMSHAYDSWLEKRPVLTWSLTLVTAAHLLNILPDRLDPFVVRSWR